jgi:hydrocephalus-inducing protein
MVSVLTCMPVASAPGMGSSVVCEELASGTLDFGFQFAARPFSTELEVANLGRRTVNLSWTNLASEELRKEYSKLNKSSAKKFDPSTLPPELQPVFSVAPEKAALGPKDSVVFTFSGMTSKVGELTERLVCMGLHNGANAKSARRLFETDLVAEVSLPLLEFSERCLEFSHCYKKGVPTQPITKPLTLRYAHGGGLL